MNFLKGLGAACLAAVVVFGLWLWWAFWGAAWIAQAWLPAVPGHAVGVGPNLDDLGKTGDLFGGVNALFAALAFVGVAVAAYMQFRTIGLMQEQHARDSFEPLFFKLLDRLKRPDRLEYPGDGGRYQNGRPFAEFVEGLRADICQNAAYVNAVAGSDGDGLRTWVCRAYLPAYEANESALGPYMRSLYHVFKLVHGSGLSEAVRVQYANIARAALSSDELFLLMVNCACPIGLRFRPLLEEYGLLKHIERGSENQQTPDEQITFLLYRRSALLSHEGRRLDLIR